jgi:uncharacterized protein (TIGR02186 family)
MRRLALIGNLLLAASVMGSSPAAAERLVTTISRHQVMVTSNFTGTSIVLFGTVEPDTPAARRRAPNYDLVVTVVGPRQDMVVRRKERMLGIWTNVDARAFDNVPSYLAVLSNRPFESVADQETQQRLQIGLENMVAARPQDGQGGAVAVPRDDPFFAQFIRLKTEQALYLERTNGVTFLTPTVFRAAIPLPAHAPVGNYDVDLKVFAAATMVARANSAFEIVKVGFEQFVVTAAHQYGLLYGIATAMMAIFTGWFASVVFRRD